MVDATTDTPQEGVEVRLTGTGPGGPTLERTVVTDKRGAYRFERLPTGDDVHYAVDATFQNGTFAGGAVTLPDDTDRMPVVRTTLKVWPTTTDPTSILLRRVDVFLAPHDDGVGVIEAVTVVNHTDRAYIGRAGDEDLGAASLGFALPDGADASGVAIVDADLDIPVLVPSDFGFSATIAIPPGERRIIYSYRIPGEAATFDLTRTSLYPTLEMTVFAPEPLLLSGNRIRADGEQRIGDKTYAVYRVEDELDAGDPVQLIARADAGMPVPLTAGLIAALALVVAMAGLSLARGRRRPRAARPEARAEVVRAIAALDLRHAAGEIDDREYEVTRAGLKSRAEALTHERTNA